ncbi:MAG: DNA-binding protein [Ardenticatenaceae bacterium]|nr:MAG: DNA-binding protein [Ardenticatenaceae bacterium]
MNEQELHALITYRLNRAEETLVEARLMQKEEHWNTCANRLYYAAFYAVSALLLKEGYVATKHTGIKSMFNQHFVKTAVISKENGRLYNRLFNLRQEGDYVDFVSFEAVTIQPLIEETAVFIDKIRSLLTQE